MVWQARYPGRVGWVGFILGVVEGSADGGAYRFFLLFFSFCSCHTGGVMSLGFMYVCLSLSVCFFLSTFLVRSGHGLIWAAASRILVLCFSGYPQLPPVAGAFSGLEGFRGVGACHGGRSDGWFLVLLLSGRAWRRDGMGGVMAEEWVLFRLFPPLGCFSSTELSCPRRLGVFEREGVESRQILERTGSVRRGGSIKGRARVPPSRHTPHHDMADNIKHQTKTRKKDFGKHISWIRRPWTSFRRNIP